MNRTISYSWEVYQIRHPDFSPEAVRQRRQMIGRLLRNRRLTLTAIGKEVGVSREAVRLIQRKYFPAFSRGKKGNVNGTRI